MPCVPMVVIRSSRSSASANLFRQHVVHIAVGEIALLLADLDQARAMSSSNLSSIAKIFLLS